MKGPKSPESTKSASILPNQTISGKGELHMDNTGLNAKHHSFLNKVVFM